MRIGILMVWVFGLFCAGGAGAGEVDRSIAAYAEALDNIASLHRPGQVGYATIWDGNKYVQCSRIASGVTVCQAAGTRMQPSLERVVDFDRLAALGWTRDERFGNFLQLFPPEAGTATISAAVLAVLTEAYDVDPAWLEIRTQWLPEAECPPRNGPTQNLAGMVNDMPMAIRVCSYDAAPAPVGDHEATVVAEIQRLRINAGEAVFAVFDAGIGYVQCAPDDVSQSLYCEAQSAESWPALAALLTPDRVALLHRAGYSDPGRAPNYWKIYALEQESDAAIAGEILTLLRDVYGFTGAWDLEIHTD